MVPSLLLAEVRKELERGENMGIISRIDEPMDWFSSMVPMPTKNGSVKICIDLLHLNEAVC